MTDTYTPLATPEPLCFEEMTFGHGTAELEVEPVTMGATVWKEPRAVVKPDSSGSSGPVAGGGVEDDPAAARVIGKLATGLAGILVEAFRDLLARKADENRALSCSIEQQEDRLAAAAEGLIELSGRIERLAEGVSGQKSVGLATQQKCEHLTAGLESLWEANKRHESAAADLRKEMQELSGSVTDRLDALLHRLGLQHEEISALKCTASEVSPRVAAIVERLDRQAEAIRSIWEAQVQREAALDDLVAALTRLKASGFPGPVAGAAQL